MAYLHCHTKGCGWSQDDFWEQDHKGWTPFRQDTVEDWKRNIFKDKIYFDRNFFMENASLPYQEDEDGFFCKGTDLVAWELERKARIIRGMLVRTYDEWKKVKNDIVCPRCGKQNWDID